MASFKSKHRGIYWRLAGDGTKRYDAYFQGMCRTFRREGDAAKWKRQLEVRNDKGDQPTSDKRSFATYLAEWLELKASGAVRDRRGKQKEIGPRTLFDYQTLLRNWIIEPAETKQLPAVGDVRIDRVTDGTLEQLYKAMMPYTTVGTIQQLNRLLGQAFEVAVKKGILARNPAEWANVPRVDTSKQRADDGDDDGPAKAMTEEEAERFLASARAIADEQERKTDVVPPIPERCWSALWHILVGCGLRPGEALALRWQDIDEVGQTIQVRKNLIRIPGIKGHQLLPPKTKKSRREVPIPAPVWDETKRWRKVQKHQRIHAGDAWKESGFVLTNSKGGPLHDVRRAFARVSARARLGEWGPEPKREHVTGPVPKRDFIPAFRVYDCRHTYVTLLLMASTPVNVVADLVGHEQASFTIARYGHALPKQTKEAVATLEAVLFRKTG